MSISPWQQNDVELKSPDGSVTAILSDLMEIAMGAPTAGTLVLSNGLSRMICNPSMVWSVSWREWTEEGMLRMAEGIAAMCRGWDLEAMTCAELIELNHLGIAHSRCIDPALLAKISGDEGFRRFLGCRTGLTGLEPIPSGINMKDRGQRTRMCLKRNKSALNA